MEEADVFEELDLRELVKEPTFLLKYPSFSPFSSFDELLGDVARMLDRYSRADLPFCMTRPARLDLAAIWVQLRFPFLLSFRRLCLCQRRLLPLQADRHTGEGSM